MSTVTVYKVVFPGYMSESEDCNEIISPNGFDALSGYILLARPEQIPMIIRNLYSVFRELLLLKIDYEWIASDIRWKEVTLENETDIMPCYYGELQRKHIVDTIKIQKDRDGVLNIPQMI
ncbi:hypothetical protein K7432_004960 [Basidiobolus ranarum]|uniref:Uncharacterized protein n=1 Tax=Basidiobolus ranarum TaxID=34480 RepID=A0ABR2WXC9_9FUNG